ncbi:SDR family oxidoreductase [Candidatus Parcubacteria bacterium]|nr:MAG: SDR family oxidoreductase [Candidatus Parcubacteria bacterium]
MANTYALSGKHILITGANGQLGSGLAARFTQEGAIVHVSDIQEIITPDLAKALTALGASFTYHKLDISKESDIKKVVDELPALNVLVNNAGIAVFTPFEERTPEELDAVMDVNIKGTILTAKICAAKMTGKDGKIINIGSIYGVVPGDKRIYGDSGRNTSEIYAATKAGVIHLTKYLAAYLADKGITVNAVSPGGIFSNQKDFFVAEYTNKTPLKRMASVDDIANAVLFLASSDAGYITGQNLVVDGGFSLNQ